MIRAFFGIERIPFSQDKVTLLPHQQEVFDILKVHSHQGGFCLLMGEPGTGKTVIKKSIIQSADKTTIVVHIARTLHTYVNTIKILCQAFNVDYTGSNFKCEKRLIQEAFNINNHGKAIIIIIDDAQLMDMTILRRLRLMFEDFPKNHNIILLGETSLLHNMALSTNLDIKSRITYSTILKKLNPDDMESFVLKELDEAGLPHNIFTENALGLIIRSGDGILRNVRNICLACMVEAVRKKERTIDIKTVNTVLIQPHFRIEKDLEAFL